MNNIYFMVLIGVQILGLGLTLARHGEPKTGKENFWATLVSTVLDVTLVYFAIKQGF